MKKTFFVFLSCIGVLAADSVSLNVNSDTLEVGYVYRADNLLGYQEGTSYSAFIDYIRNENDDDLIKAGFLLSNGLEGAESIVLTFGLESNFADDYIVLALIGRVGWILPLEAPFPKTMLTVSLEYAPSILSFDEADRYREYRFEADMEPIDHFHLYAGYRSIDTDYERYDYRFDESWYGGIRFSF